ncbi:PaaI family thioesterase [Paracraurococcus lichenis]|uniref:PaaI family thioesterase n=1 Tax=Paracraurococcus lichenis TaxID=3064888 RepID=A0ABT9E8F4_9PROT|nr:PaaI family thioesterase [Paracraurococcus sp. LOR1-02]MDO9712253.1 PaaI family thioesterase [Paracraurococcus sp. LOR1-02]
MLPFAKLLGMTFTAAEPDRVTAEMPVRDDLCTRPAVLHGGAIMAFADMLGAAGSRRPPGTPDNAAYCPDSRVRYTCAPAHQSASGLLSPCYE